MVLPSQQLFQLHHLTRGYLPDLALRCQADRAALPEVSSTNRRRLLLGPPLIGVLVLEA